MSVYLEHFGLREAPFRITPHTEFFFSGGNRGSTLDALVYAVTHDEGIVKVTGEVGSGKTMLCRMLLERLPDAVETIYLANPALTRSEILFALADELGIATPPTRTHRLLRTIQQRLIDLYAAGRRIVVLIDEAHAMPVDSLEEIRLLSNLESNRHKLVQIILFGQPELDELLSRKEMRPLRERITHNFALEPFRRPDIGAYINFRLNAAGHVGAEPFSAAAVQLIAASSVGLTRRVNILADKALLAAFADNAHRVDAAQAKAAIRDAQFGPLPGARAIVVAPRQAVIAAGLGIALATAGLGWIQTGTLLPPRPAADAADVLVVAGAADPTTPTRPPGAVPTTASAAALPQPTAISVLATPAGAAPPIDTPLLSRYRKAFDVWLPRAPDDHYFIQLLRTRADSIRDVEAFIERHGKSLEKDKLRAYRSSINGQEWLGVIYGDYRSRDEAALAIAELPAGTRANAPYARAVKLLR